MSDEPTPEVIETPAPEADPTPESQDEPGKSLSPAEVEALISKFKKEKSAANREAQAVKKRLEEFEKAEAERKQAEMSELEKLQAKVQEAQAALAEKDAAIAQAKREAAARDAGVDPAYVDYAASAYAKDPDNPDFWDEFKKSHPAMFGGNGEAPGSAGGGPSTTGTNSKAAELSAIKERISQLQMNRGSDKVELELQRLFDQAAAIQKELTH